MTKRSVLFGIIGFALAFLLFSLFWGMVIGLDLLPEHLEDWAIILSALIIPTIYAATHESEFGSDFVDLLKFIGLILVSCVSANMIGFALGSIITFIEAIIIGDYETIISLLAITFLPALLSGTPGVSITIWVFEN